MNLHKNPLRLALVGCGAVSELYYAPALLEALKYIQVEIVAICDPSVVRLDVLHKFFPFARCFTDLNQALILQPDAAIVASPPRFHAVQATALFAAGSHVLCEKPMASSVSEAESMIIAASAAQRVLAIGLFRRFLPALRFIHSLIIGGALGPVRSFVFSEGGPFSWPATSPSFFQKQYSQGGVLLDLGVHVLDLVCWWFGEPNNFIYADDAMGNLEANSHLSMTFSKGVTGDVRLSRDTKIRNNYIIDFERGQVLWSIGDGNHLDLRLNGVPFQLCSELHSQNTLAASYQHSFVNQLLNFFAASLGLEDVIVPGEEAIRSMRLIESCYRERKLMEMPWLSHSEIIRANQLVVG